MPKKKDYMSTARARQKEEKDKADKQTEQLILEVQKYQCLYDKAHKDHRNIPLRNKIFKKIARVCGFESGK